MSTTAFRFIRPTREYRELSVLSEIGRGAPVSQRGLARVAGVSSAMVNAYIDGLVGCGFLEVTGDTNRSYRYSLTGAGRARCGELYFQFAREASRFFGEMQGELRSRLLELEATG